MKRLFFYCLLSLIGISDGFVFAQKTSKYANKTLIVFFDGLRPDYITPELMPNLYAFKKDGCFNPNHHSVFPTVTRVNSSSYATGAYPGTHGLLGNAVYFPEVNKSNAIGTGYEDLSKAAKAISGPLLTAVSLGEALQTVGEKMMVFSSGTTGQAFLQNYKVNGAIVNPGLILPESFKAQVLTDLGAAPKDDVENDQERHKWITDGLIRYGFAAEGPLVSAIWFSDPDGAAHSHGIGSDEAVAAIRFVDGQFGRILDELKSKKLTEHVNIVISTDHGFVTHVGKINLSDFLISEGFKKGKNSDDIVIAEGAVYVKDHDKMLIQKIVSALQQQDWVGAIFTKAEKSGDNMGWVAGTLSYGSVHYDHSRAGDILVSYNWDDRKNNRGYAGTDFSGGVAGHGGSSPYEINIALMAKGPGFNKNYTDKLPSSNVDIAPTILKMYGIAIPESMDGRPITEFLKNDTTKPQIVKKDLIETSVKYAWGTYRLMLDISVLGKYRYVNFVKTTRARVKQP